MRIVLDVDPKVVGVAVAGLRTLADHLDQLGTAEQVESSLMLRQAAAALEDETKWIAVVE